MRKGCRASVKIVVTETTGQGRRSKLEVGQGIGKGDNKVVPSFL